MRFQNLLIILIISIVFTGCGSCEESSVNNSKTSDTNINNNINNKANTNEPTNQVNSNNNGNAENDINSSGGFETIQKPTEKIPAVTLKPVLDAYCDAMRKRDDAGLRKVFSNASIKSFEADMKEDGIKTISEFLENEPVGDKCELVNENIQGDLGEATVITETYPKGTAFKFVKENNVWKLTNQSSDFDRVNKK